MCHCHQNIPPKPALLFLLKELLLILMISDKTSEIETAEPTLSKCSITRDIIVFKIYTYINQCNDNTTIIPMSQSW